MSTIVSTYNELFNLLIKMNGENTQLVNFICTYNTNNNIHCKIPMSNKYFLTLIDNSNFDVINFFSYINDDTRIVSFPFEKKNNIDYSLMLESTQFYNIELQNSFLTEISLNLDKFFKIVKESSGEINLIIDIKFLIDFELLTKQKSQSNHLIDAIIWKLKNNKINSCIIIDPDNIIKNCSNMLYIQLESCLINFDKTKYDFNKNLVVFKSIDDSIVETVYWNVLLPEMKISEVINKIKSPFDNTYFDIVKINEKYCFLYNISIKDCIGKNLLNLNNEPGIIIEPIDRLCIYANINI